MNMNETIEHDIINALADGPKNRDELCALVSMKRTPLYERLQKMIRRGVIKKFVAYAEGATRGRPIIKFALPAEPEPAWEWSWVIKTIHDILQENGKEMPRKMLYKELDGLVPSAIIHGVLDKLLISNKIDQYYDMSRMSTRMKEPPVVLQLKED